MTPGRELDALVAEKVMGWTKLEGRWARIFPGVEGDTICANLDGSIPSYSTDIAAAWQVVVEKFVNDGFRIHYDINYGVERRTGWSVVINGIVYHEFSNTAPLAICLAALKAVGE